MSTKSSSRKRPFIAEVGAAAVLVFLAPALVSAATGPELSISARGDVHIVGVELANRNAINLLSVTVWGLKLILPIDRFTAIETADGRKIEASEISLGHRLEIKGRASDSQPGWLDVRLIRDLSLGTPAPSRVEPPPAPPPTAQASVSAALTPPPAPPSPKAAEGAAPAPAVSGKLFLTQNLRPGMRGREVVMLQEFLQKQGWGIPDDGPVTGYYGQVTANAVKKFQAANGLPPEGEVGPKTRALVNSFLK